MRCASYVATAVLLLGPALPSIAPAQDVMQLDTMFRDSLLRKPESQAEGSRLHEQAVVVRRHPKRHRHKEG
jgi:hypothetical protein